MTPLNSQRGFTLVELIMVIAVYDINNADCSLLRVVESALRNENYPGLDSVHQPMFTVDPA